MKKYKGKYRIESVRLQTWDYGSNAHYFITICTHNRDCFFGEVCNGKMQLSTIGHIANSCWYEIPNHFPFVALGAHVIMPNHVHGIITIDKPNVQTQNFLSLPQSKNQFRPQSQNLASIIRGFKIGVTKNARLIHADFAWQPRYHDHIIRNEKSYQNISNYILENPLKWAEDKFYYPTVETQYFASLQDMPSKNIASLQDMPSKNIASLQDMPSKNIISHPENPNSD